MPFSLLGGGGGALWGDVVRGASAASRREATQGRRVAGEQRIARSRHHGDVPMVRKEGESAGGEGLMVEKH